MQKANRNLQSNNRRRTWPKRIVIAVVAVLVLGGVGFGAYVSDYYHADTPVASLSTEAIPVVETDSTIAVGNPTNTGIVFYPGAKVDPASYVPLMQDLSHEGFYCVIAKMPFNLAFFNINAASSITAEAGVEHWWIAGHSLGGAMAAQYASEHADELDGIVFLGAYAASDLSETDLKALVIYGSEDGVLNRSKLAESENLPANSETIVIEGGNHAQFGNYGPQSGDGDPTITAQNQQRQTAEAIAKATA